MIPSMKLRFAAGMLLALSTAVSASAGAGQSSDKPADYANAMPVAVSGKQAVVRLSLPKDVYLNARRTELQDLRLFDARGVALPFAFVWRLGSGGERRWSGPVAVFPAYAPPDAQGLEERLQIRTGADGAVIAVTAPAPAARGAADVLASLVLDLRAESRAAGAPGAQVAALAFTLPASASNYSARVLLETSDDLQDWHEVAEATLSWLANSQGARVSQDRIAFTPRAFRYARLRWLEGRPIEFAAVQADYVQSLPTRPAQESIVLQPTPGLREGDLVYAAPVGVPVEAVGLAFQSPNIIVPAQIGYYRKLRTRGGVESDEVQLQTVVHGTFYRFTQDGQPRLSPDLGVPRTHAAQWVVRPTGKLAERPGLRLHWTPASIVFLAGGQGPYTLAYGRAGVASHAVRLDEVAPGFSTRELGALEVAQAGQPLRQAGDGSGQDAAREASARRTVWLWVLLLCGVGALGAMAWRLMRQLKEAPPAEGISGHDDAPTPPPA